MTMDDLSRSLRTIIRTAMGMPENSVRPTNQEVPAGGQVDVLATVSLASITDASWAETSLLVEQNVQDGTEHTQVAKVAMASVNFYRGTAKDAAGKAKWTLNGLEMASRLCQRLQLAQNIELLQAAGIGLLRASAARDLTAVRDAIWESRGQVDLFLDVVITDSAPIGTFKSAQIGMFFEPPGLPVQPVINPPEVIP